jgi:hypothetical protein
VKHLALVVTAAACLASACAGKARLDLRQSTIVVLPANDQTSDMQGASASTRDVVDHERSSVGGRLASETRYQFERLLVKVTSDSSTDAAIKGRVPKDPASALTITKDSGLNGFVLYFEVRRWEPRYPGKPRALMVDVSSSLIDPQSGKTVWREAHGPEQILTPNASSIAGAYEEAERLIAWRVTRSICRAAGIRFPITRWF